MRVKLTTTITSFIEVSAENTDQIEVARKEIFGRYNQLIEEDEENGLYIEGVKVLQRNAVVHDTVVATEVSHEFGAVDE